MTQIDYLTKQDLADCLETYFRRTEIMVHEVVGSIVGDAMQLISERFDRLEAKMDKMSDTVDHHSIDIHALQRNRA